MLEIKKGKGKSKPLIDPAGRKRLADNPLGMPVNPAQGKATIKQAKSRSLTHKRKSPPKQGKTFSLIRDLFND